MTTTPEQLPRREAKSGVVDTMTTRAPGLVRLMVEAMDAAGLGTEPLLNWRADPVSRTIIFSAPGEVK